jgi:transcriptional regulator with GAF, ATPase, and Fis domain
VRELENVMERAVITAVRRLDESRARLAGGGTRSGQSSANRITDCVYSIAELEALERQNFQRALQRCNGRISGEQGAAQLLGMKPSTLASRLKVLGLKSAG